MVRAILILLLSAVCCLGQSFTFQDIAFLGMSASNAPSCPDGTNNVQWTSSGSVVTWTDASGTSHPTNTLTQFNTNPPCNILSLSITDAITTITGVSSLTNLRKFEMINSVDTVLSLNLTNLYRLTNASVYFHTNLRLITVSGCSNLIVVNCSQNSALTNFLGWQDSTNWSTANPAIALNNCNIGRMAQSNFVFLSTNMWNVSAMSNRSYTIAEQQLSCYPNVSNAAEAYVLSKSDIVYTSPMQTPDVGSQNSALTNADWTINSGTWIRCDTNTSTIYVEWSNDAGGTWNALTDYAFTANGYDEQYIYGDLSANGNPQDLRWRVYDPDAGEYTDYGGPITYSDPPP